MQQCISEAGVLHHQAPLCSVDAACMVDTCQVWPGWHAGWPRMPSFESAFVLV